MRWRLLLSLLFPPYSNCYLLHPQGHVVTLNIYGGWSVRE